MMDYREIPEELLTRLLELATCNPSPQVPVVEYVRIVAEVQQLEKLTRPEEKDGG